MALIAAGTADRDGNLYTGPNTEDTPTFVEATAFRDGIVIAQVNDVVDAAEDLPRVDISGDRVDFVIPADRPYQIEPLFTRDPRHITARYSFAAHHLRDNHARIHPAPQWRRNLE